MEVFVAGQGVPERIAERIPNLKAQDDKPSLALKG